MNALDISRSSPGSLRTIRSRIQVPPADRMSERHIRAFAKAAQEIGARIALHNGLVIGPNGIERRVEPWKIPPPTAE